jgi:hypothetical protein
MTDLSRLDTASPSDVPALCLLIADHLDERGEDGIGWRALGETHRCPHCVEDRMFLWFMSDADPRAQLPWEWLRASDAMQDGNNCWLSRSSALSAAALAFVELPEETKREILGMTNDAVCYCGMLMDDHHQGSSCTTPREMTRD